MVNFRLDPFEAIDERGVGSLMLTAKSLIKSIYLGFDFSFPTGELTRRILFLESMDDIH
jgi:hypothetical protein